MRFAIMSTSFRNTMSIPHVRKNAPYRWEVCFPLGENCDSTVGRVLLFAYIHKGKGVEYAEDVQCAQK